jgi:FG-GAP-like repeat
MAGFLRVTVPDGMGGSRARADLGRSCAAVADIGGCSMTVGDVRPRGGRRLGVRMDEDATGNPSRRGAAKRCAAADRRGCGVPDGFVEVPGWTWWQNAGAGLTVADLDGEGLSDLVVLTVDDPAGRNAAYYRVGAGFVDGTVTGGWGPWWQVPDWFSEANADAGVAVADVDGDGHPDLVVLMVDAPPGQNAGWYRVGHHLAADGAVTAGWGPWLPVPDWTFWENQGADVVVADVDGDGHLDLVVVMVDAPEGGNAGYYRLGRHLAADGTVTGGWGPWIPIPDWHFWENQGAGAVVADLDGDGRLELVVFCVDNPVGNNGGFYTVGWGLDATGRAADGWGPWTQLAAWPFWENAGAAIAVTQQPGAPPTGSSS